MIFLVNMVAFPMAILDYHGGYVTDLNFPPDPMDLEGTIRLKRPNKYPSIMYA